MGVLLKRMEEIREQEEGLNRAANRNWMQGLCSHRCGISALQKGTIRGPSRASHAEAGTR
jgi:hypothetical protein